MKKVSFDYDDTLTEIDVKEYYKELYLRDDVEIWLCTFRSKSGQWAYNSDLFESTLELDLALERLIFTEGEDKSEFLAGNDFIWHLDDSPAVIEDLEKTDCKGIRYKPKLEWKAQCEALLKG